MVFGSRCIRASERSHRRCLRGLSLLNLTENVAFLNRKTEERDLNILLFNYLNDLVLGSAETNFLEIVAYVSLKGATAGFGEGRFC